MAENGDDFFSYPNLDSLLINGALAHIDCMESRHLSMLLRTSRSSHPAQASFLRVLMVDEWVYLWRE